MSVRRRAVRERVERARKLQAGYDQQKRAFDAMLALCDRKKAAGETSISIEELSACFTPPQGAPRE